MQACRTLFLLLWLFLSLSNGNAQAVYKCFLQMDGLPGQSTDAQHKNWCDILSFQLGDTNAIAHSGSGGPSVGRPSLFNLVVVKEIDNTSPLLTLRCAMGQTIPKVTLVCAKRGPHPIDFYKVTISEVLIAGVRVTGDVDAKSPLPVESISFNYRKVKWEYVPQNQNGKTGPPVTGEWDADTNTGH